MSKSNNKNICLGMKFAPRTLSVHKMKTRKTNLIILHAFQAGEAQYRELSSIRIRKPALPALNKTNKYNINHYLENM